MTRQKYGLGKSRQDKRDGKLEGGIFFVPGLCKEYAEESYILRQALNVECHLSDTKLVITDTARSKCFRVGGSLSLVGGMKNIQLGVWGVLLAPQWVQGKALMGVQGAKPPEAPGFQHI